MAVTLACLQSLLDPLAVSPATNNSVLENAHVGGCESLQAYMDACLAATTLAAVKIPTFPKPMMARTLPTMETPTYLVRSHLPALTEASAWATLRLRAVMSAIPCSAAAMVLAVGAFTTRQPDCKTHRLSLAQRLPQLPGLCIALGMLRVDGSDSTMLQNHTSVAAWRSTLSIPTPARPTTFNLPLEASNTALVTCTDQAHPQLHQHSRCVYGRSSHTSPVI